MLLCVSQYAQKPKKCCWVGNRSFRTDSSVCPWTSTTAVRSWLMALHSSDPSVSVVHPISRRTPRSERLVHILSGPGSYVERDTTLVVSSRPSTVVAPRAEARTSRYASLLRRVLLSGRRSKPNAMIRSTCWMKEKRSRTRTDSRCVSLLCILSCGGFSTELMVQIIRLNFVGMPWTDRSSGF